MLDTRVVRAEEPMQVARLDISGTDPQNPKQTHVPRRAISQGQIMQIKNTLVQRYAPRNHDMEILVNAWHGNYYVTQDLENMSSTGAPILRVADRSSQPTPMTINMIKGFADAYKRGLVFLPDMRIPRPPQMFASDLSGQTGAEEWMARMKRAGYGIWDASQMQLQQVGAAWWLPVCGSYGIVVLPDFTRGHAVIKFVAPWSIYGVPKFGDPYSLSRCIVVAREDPLRLSTVFDDDVIGDWGTGLGGSELTAAGGSAEQQAAAIAGTEHVIYLDENWFVRIIGSKEVARVYHGLGFCPALISPFILLPEYSNRGHSAVEQAVPMQLSANFAASMWEEAMKEEVFGTLAVIDPQNIPANFKPGTGQIISVNPGGDVKRVSSGGGALQTVRSHIEMMRGLMEHNTGASSVATEGTTGSSVETGRGIEKASGPYLAALEEVQQTQGFYMARALYYAFRMTADHEMWESDPEEEVTFTGLMRGSEVMEKITRAELARVSMPEMVYSPMAHLGLHERVNIALQLMNAPLPGISWNKLIEFLGLYRDIPELRAEVESDLAWQLQIALSKAQAAQGVVAPTETSKDQPGTGTTPANATRASAAVEAGATNTDTLRRAGMAGPGGKIPAGGAATVPMPPIGTTLPRAAEAPGAALDPSGLARLMEEGPETERRVPPTGLESDAGLGDTIRAELTSIVDLHADAFYDEATNTLVADWRDVKKIRETLSHHKGLKVKPAGKRGSNVPRGVVVAQKGESSATR